MAADRAWTTSSFTHFIAPDLAALMLVAVSPRVTAASFAATITGTVTGPDRAVLPGAVLVITNTSTA